jgi:hypothetical protein
LNTGCGATNVNSATLGNGKKITFGEMRETGVHHVLIYCTDQECSHHVEISADRDYLIPTTRV